MGFHDTEAYAIKTLTAAVKSLEMTDKQILAACRPVLWRK